MIYGVVNAVNRGAIGVDMIESKMEEFHKHHVGKLDDCKARILQLENQVASLRVREVGSSTSAPIATRDIYLQSM